MTLVAALLLGVVIGLSLGALGGGGSILTVPALVYVISEPARAATTESLVIVGLTSLVAAIGHARAGHVRWSAGIAFGLTGVIASYAGTALNRRVDPNLLLLAFAGLIVLAAVAMLLRVRRPAKRPAVVPASVGGGGTHSGVEEPAGVADSLRRGAFTPGVVVKVVAAGLVVGFLTGFFGVGGGFVIVPALVMAMGFEMPIAVGTSLLVIAINSAAALAARSGSETFHWAVIVPFTLAAIVGSLAGKLVADKVSSVTLTKAFVGLLAAVAIYVAIRSGVALSG
jgi:uncharacterized membrane protein YfcA